jgi:LysR family transcriptional regulator, transcriptional activator for bauABCD operon
MLGRVSDIDLRLLRIFVTVVESGGFAVATAKLNVAESTVSQHMSDLEKRLGLRLCERGRSGFRLTKAGEEVYAATTALLHDLDGFRDRLALLSGNVSGRFMLGLPDAVLTMAPNTIVDAIQKFHDQMPEMHLQISMLSPRELERQVLDGKIAAAISPEHRRVAGLDYRPLFQETNLLYCGAGHPLFDLANESITVNMLEQQPRISRGYHEGFDTNLLHSENYAATVHETEAAALLIATGRYMGFLPDHYAEQWVRERHMRALLPDHMRFSVHFNLIVRRDQVESLAVKQLAKCLSISLNQTATAVVLRTVA